MIFPKDNGLTVYGFFTASGLGATGLTVTFSCYEGTSGTPVVNAQNATELAGGFYYYTISSGTIDANAGYVYKFVTAGTADQKEIAGIFVTPAWATKVNTLTFTGADVKATLDSETVTVGTNNDKTGYGLADDAITASKFDETTAFPVKSADTGATAIARVGADSDTLETLSDQLDTIKAKTDLIPAAPATEAKQDTIIGYIDTEVAAIKAKTDTIPINPATEAKQDTIIGYIDTEVAAIKAKTDLIPASPAQAGEYTATLATIEGKVDAIDDYVDTEVGAIKVVTDKLDTALELDGAVYRYTTNALEQAPTGGSAPTVEAIRQEIDANSTQLAAIVDDTNELQTNQGNWLTATGFSTHSAADVWAVANRSLTTFGTLIADIWTYVTRSLTDKAGFTISGTKTTLDSLNDLSAAQVNAEVDTALADYDAPTKAELDLAVAPLATSANLAVVDGNVDDIKAVTVKLDTALELDGAVYRYTANALEESPAATGGDATAANQTAIINAISALNDLSATDVEDAVLDAVTGDHSTAGTVGAAIIAAGSAGDPWITDPSDETTYPDGTAGYMITELSELLTASSGLIQAQTDTDNLYIRRGDSWTQAFTLGDITGYDNIWFTVKKSHSDTDAQAVIQIDSDTGMIRLNGAAATALDGSITVTNVATGLISVAIKYGATEDLRCLSGLYYDVQVLIGTTKTTKYIGKLDVLYDITKR